MGPIIVSPMKTKSLLLATLVAFSTLAPFQEPAAPDMVNTTVYVELMHDNLIVGCGSGVIISEGPDYKILTAGHLIQEGTSITIKIKEDVLPATLVSLHTDLDIAILNAHSDKHYYHSDIDYSVPVPKTPVYSAGFPLGMVFCLTEGIVNYSVANISDKSWLCTAPAYLGNSGGGVFRKDNNKLIGISISLLSRPGPFQSTPIPHVHIFVPLNVVEEWIKGALK